MFSFLAGQEGSLGPEQLFRFQVCWWRARAAPAAGFNSHTQECLTVGDSPWIFFFSSSLAQKKVPLKLFIMQSLGTFVYFMLHHHPTESSEQSASDLTKIFLSFPIYFSRT